MNVQVVYSSVLACCWLALAIYLLFVADPLGGVDARLLGVLAMLLMTWNIVRAVVAWKSARSEARDGYTP